MDLRFPNITAQNDPAKISQMQSYLFQLVQDLNYALADIDKREGNISLEIAKKSSDTKQISPQDAVDTFNSIKALIIKSADIVEAYYDVLRYRLDGAYLAQSDFGVYVEQTSQQINANSSMIEQLFSQMEEVITDITSIMTTNAYIRTGHIDDKDGIPVYGVEVGQQTKIDGQDVFNKYARFTAGGIYFYMPGANEAVAYMTGQTLYITNAQITQSLKLGGYKLDLTSGIKFRWVGV